MECFDIDSSKSFYFNIHGIKVIFHNEKMKKTLTLILFLILNIHLVKATVNQIRWGSTGDPLNGLTLTWSNNGTADSVRWGYTNIYEQGSFAGVRRNGYSSGIYFFKYVFPVVNSSATIYYQIFDSGTQSWNNQITFSTAPDPSTGDFTFAALGDCRDYPATLTSISNLVTARHPSLCLFNGDLTISGNSASQYNTFFTAASNFLQNNLI